LGKEPEKLPCSAKYAAVKSLHASGGFENRTSSKGRAFKKTGKITTDAAARGEVDPIIETTIGHF